VYGKVALALALQHSVGPQGDVKTREKFRGINFAFNFNDALVVHAVTT
jgi:hypothetical protein